MAKRIIIPEIKLSGDYLTSAISIQESACETSSFVMDSQAEFHTTNFVSKTKEKRTQITLHWKVKKTKVKKKPTKTKSYEEENQPRI